MNWVLSILSSGGQAPPVSMEWLAELSADRYRPMLRILDESDFRFLRAQPGFRHELEKRLRQQRALVLRVYLRMLVEDFRRVCHSLRHVMVAADCDRSRLAAVLMQQQAAFAWGMMLVRFRLLLYGWGLAQVDATRPVGVFDGMRLALTAMTLLAIRAAA
jgi:hypothetical protein